MPDGLLVLAPVDGLAERSHLAIARSAPLLAQFELLDLARAGQWELVDRKPLLRDLARRQVLSHLGDTKVNRRCLSTAWPGGEVGCSIMATSMVGTPSIAVPRWVSISSSINPGSKASTSTMVDAVPTEPREQQTEPPMWNSGILLTSTPPASTPIRMPV